MTLGPNPTKPSTPTRRRLPKIIVVGAGPAGSACALELRRRAAAEVVLLDRATYPRRKVCGSGLSPMALTQLRHLEMLDALRDVHVEMKGLRAVGPSGSEVTLRGSKGAWVVPRAELDHRLVQAAVRRGARLLEGTRVMEVLRAPDGSARGVRTRDGEIEADLVVIANGSPSTFELDTHPREGIRTIVGWWQATLPGDLGVMIWDARLGGYYAWAFPEPGGVVNVGLTIPERFERSSGLRELFDEILGEHFQHVVGPATQLGRWAGHPATVTTRVGKIIAPRSIFVGEAARLVCPGTVEGISFALQSGCIAARTIERSFDADRGFSTAGRYFYRFELTRQMLPEFLAGEALYRVMRSPSLRGRISQLVPPRHLAKGLAHFVGEHGEAA